MIIDPRDIPALYEKHGSLRAAAKALKVSNGSVQKAYRRAVEIGVMQHVALGKKSHAHQKQLLTKQTIKAYRAKKVRHKSYILSYAQNNTEVHAQTFENLQALADAEEARILVSQALYNRSSQTSRDKGALTGHLARGGVWYDPVLVPYLNNERLEIAKGLTWCGELNISPTAERPLRGLEVYTGRSSMIVPHTRLHMQSIATIGGSGAKFNYTTGAVTMRNYIQRKEGFKAEFNHTYGGLLVTVNEENGNWWTRQLSATSEGVICDLDRRVEGGKITTGHRVEAISFGDIHVDEIDRIVAEATWGEGGMVDVLRPRFQFFHDVLDFYRRSHHDSKDVYKMFKRFVEGKESVAQEVDGVAAFLEWAKRKDSQSVVVPSNHDRFMERWLREQDGRRDPVNAEFWSDLNNEFLKHIRQHGEEPNALKLALEMRKDPEWLEKQNVFMLNGGESFVICPKHSGGIECGLHFDLGSNGVRGALGVFAKLGRRSNGGHSHSAGILDGAWQAGTKSKLVLPYNRNAPSSWSHSDIITHENSKRQMVTFFDGKWRAPQ